MKRKGFLRGPLVILPAPLAVDTGCLEIFSTAPRARDSCVSYPLHCEPKQSPFFPSLLLLSSLSAHRPTARSCRRVSHFALPYHHTACTTSLCYCCYLCCLVVVVAALLLHRRVAIAGSSGAPPCAVMPTRQVAAASSSPCRCPPRAPTRRRAFAALPCAAPDRYPELQRPELPPQASAAMSASSQSRRVRSTTKLWFAP
jgi:hypothetical protein